MFMIVSRYVHNTFTIFSRYVHVKFKLCSRYVHDIFFNMFTLSNPCGTLRKKPTNANDDYSKKVVGLGDDKIHMLNSSNSSSTRTTLQGLVQEARRMLLLH